MVSPLFFRIFALRNYNTYNNMDVKQAKQTIEAGKAILGIEFGSTRIKAVLIDQENKPIAQGWTDCGRTASTLSGRACRIAMPTCART